MFIINNLTKFVFEKKISQWNVLSVLKTLNEMEHSVIFYIIINLV